MLFEIRKKSRHYYRLFMIDKRHKGSDMSVIKYLYYEKETCFCVKTNMIKRYFYLVLER
jgi:hypothetical protein